MRQMSLPPEAIALNECEGEQGAEVIICRGPPRCDGQAEAPCPFCIRVGSGADVDEILEEIGRTT